jgi:hypothetical protein
MKVYGGGGTVLTFLKSAPDGSDWSASHHCRFTPRGLSHRYPFDRSLSGPQSRSGGRGEETNLVSLPGLEPLSFNTQSNLYTDRVILAPLGGLQNQASKSASIRGQSSTGQGMKLVIPLRLVRRIRMHGVLPLFPI